MIHLLFILLKKFKGYKLVIQSARHTHDSFGNRVFVPGISVDFKDGKFETEDKELSKLIKKHPMFGIDFRSQDSVVPSPIGLELEEKEKSAQENIQTSCPKCPFKAKNAFGLQAHMRGKHGGSSQINEESVQSDEIIED